MKDVLLRSIKNAEKTTNKLRIPYKAIELLGRNYVMDVYKDKIVLTPIKKEK